MLNWGKLVSQGRAKAFGVSWSDKEAAAVALFAKKFNKKMSEVAPYVREGILTIKAFEKALQSKDVVNPLLKLSQEKLIEKAQELGLSVSPDSTVESLVDIITKEEKKQEAEKLETEAREKAEKEKKTKEKKEADAQAKKEEAEKAAKEKAEKVAKEKAEKEAKEKTEKNTSGGTSGATEITGPSGAK